MKQTTLSWPPETAIPATTKDHYWHDESTNRVLDFHGDPMNAGLNILSDGNHHMALEASLQAFLKSNPELNDIFYATLPPQVLNGILKNRHIHLGNLKINIKPDIYIGPGPILQQWHEQEVMSKPRVFARSQGQAWLVRKGNPTGFTGLEDLFTHNIRLFISNPVSEKASHQVYRNTMLDSATLSGLNTEKISQSLANESQHVMHGTHVHHREAPQAVASGHADVSMVYYHLALRYTRIFPDIFDMIPLSGSGSENTSSQEITEYSVSCVNDNNQWTEPFIEFLCGPVAGDCYRYHGLGHCSTKPG